MLTFADYIKGLTECKVNSIVNLIGGSQIAVDVNQKSPLAVEFNPK